MKANLHTHGEFCDGKIPMRIMASLAADAGYQLLGFSAHAPLPFATEWTMDLDRVDEYLAVVRDLAARFEPRMQILAGMEIDFIDGMCGPADGRFSGLDYAIGSVHHVAPKALGEHALSTVDGRQENFDALIARGYNGDGLALAEDYFSAVASCIRAGGFDILGHLDLLRKNNPGQSRFREDHPRYRDAVMLALDCLQGEGIIVEINTGGMARGRTDSPYPQLWILKELKARGVPVCVNADAHEGGHLLRCREDGLRLAQAAGYDRLLIVTKTGRAWSPIE